MTSMFLFEAPIGAVNFSAQESRRSLSGLRSMFKGSDRIWREKKNQVNPQTQEELS